MTGQPEQALNVACAERLVEVLLPLMRQLSAETEAAGGDGLTMAQFRLLAALTRRAFTSGELASHLGVAASTVSGLVTPLERRQLVERTQAATDRRVVALRVTEQGHRCYRRMEDRLLLFLAELFARLPQETKLGLLNGLAGLDEAIGRPRPDLAQGVLTRSAAGSRPPAARNHGLGA